MSSSTNVVPIGPHVDPSPARNKPDFMVTRAERYQMCLALANSVDYADQVDILRWEGEDIDKFRYFVSLTIREYLPETTLELQLLKQVIEALLMLERASKARATMAEAKGKSWGTDVPVGLSNALKHYANSQRALLTNFQQAVKNYKAAR